ncbi:MAG: DNA repair protein RecN [Gammaproteobacteria bacterium HGW-Gammaproteobacteria-4]|jgi:DNA repair protein RecN (Recombination protein N)|nr:MAG: DNA repair protein RecN [Gammaproteobacteria bacterium HGW-Gammaproteobacteria-4]
MLRTLSIRDFAVVSEAEIRFGAGMSVVSGETGAGKSLLVDALLLLGGARADSAVVRHGAERAELNAEFDLADAPQAARWLSDEALDEDGQCQVRRVIRADGGSRAWINGRPVALAQLQALAERTVEVHGQHEAQALLARAHQLELIDAFAGHQELAATVAGIAAQWAAGERQRAEIESRGDVTERLDYLRHNLAELERETLTPEALEALDSEHRRLGHGAALIDACGRADALLAGDDSEAPAQMLSQAAAELARMVEHEPALGEVAALLESARIQVDEAQRSLERIRDTLDLDPDRLRELEQRLSRLHDLSRKHRVPVSELAAQRERLHAEVQTLADAGAAIESINKAQTAHRKAWAEAAATLGKQRRKAAALLSAGVSTLMGELGMAGGRFEVQVDESDVDTPQAQGAERVEFLVAANPGQPPRPLRKVASGGELSRISLAIEVAALGLDSVPTMVFDEVDSGIGGAVAEVVGRKLRALGSQRQVLCVTHLAQVAALGHHHVQVSKDSAGGITRSHIVTLDRAGRIEELARMLGGLEITQATRNHAKQMLGAGQTD